MHVDEVHDFFSFPSYLVFFVSLSERVLCREFCFRQLGSGCVKGERRDADWELWETYTGGTKRGGGGGRGLLGAGRESAPPNTVRALVSRAGSLCCPASRPRLVLSYLRPSCPAELGWCLLSRAFPSRFPHPLGRTWLDLAGGNEVGLPAWGWLVRRIADGVSCASRGATRSPSC